MIYLYVKTHNRTRLRYLGKTTSKDPAKYPGSGTHWRSHLKKHGNSVTTQILLATENKQELAETGLFFSKLWNVVKSKDWANLMPEDGKGGAAGTMDYAARSRKFRGETHCRSKPCIIDGIKYGSTREAESLLGVHHTTISYRCRSKGFPNYSYSHGSLKPPGNTA